MAIGLNSENSLRRRNLSSMTATRDDFEHWLFEMDDHLEKFICVLPTDVSTKMDYSADSL
jgi:hypothetical protein